MLMRVGVRRAVAAAASSSVAAAPLAPPSASMRTALLSGGMVKHRDSEGNTPDTHFDFTMANYDRVATILAKYPTNYKQSAVIPLLDLAQRQNDNFLTLAAMNKVAQILGSSPMAVYEVATFYTMFNREKVGKYFIQLCGTTPCMACGAGAIKDTITAHLGIKDGEKTEDGYFSLLEVECLGACVNAPMVQINDDYYESLTPETTIELLDACRRDEPPPLTKWGSLPMNGQLSCEGPLGKTTLIEPFPGIEKLMRTDMKFEKKVDPASVKDEMLY